MPVARLRDRAGQRAGGVVIRTTPGRPRERRHRLPRRARRRPVAGRPAQAGADLLPRQEFRRAFPGEIGDLLLPAAGRWRPTPSSCCAAIDIAGRRARPASRSSSTRGGRHRVAGAARPARPARRGRADRQQRARRGVADRDARRAHARRCTGSAELVASSRAAFGVRFDPVGERISLVDETRRARSSDERALLVVLDLVAAERRGGPGRAAGHHDPGGRAGRRFHGVDIRLDRHDARPR